MEITKEIKELIQKQLPGLHANALKDFIEESEKLKTAHEELRKLVDKQKQEITMLQNDVVEKKLQLDKVQNVLNRENSLASAERQLKEELWKFEIAKQVDAVKVSEADKRAQDAVTIATLLVKNPVLSEKFFESKFAPGGYRNNPDGSTTHIYSGDIVEERKQSREFTKKDINEI